MRNVAGTGALLATLAIALSVGGVLRAHNLDWGLPQYWVPDEITVLSQADDTWRCTPELVGERAELDSSCIPVGGAKWARFVYPHFYHYILIGARQWLGQTPPDRPRGAPAPELENRPWELVRQERAENVGAARRVSVVFSVATILGTFVTALLLFGPGRAALAALLIAVTPYHVVYSHLVNVDTPSVFWATVSTAFAVVTMRRRSVLFPIGAGFFAGLAAGTKYPGILALAPLLVTVPLARRTVGEPVFSSAGLSGVLMRWIAALVAAIVGFALVCPLCVLHFDVWVAAMVRTGVIHSTLVGARTIAPENPLLAVPLLRALATTLPFTTGWAIYLLAILATVLAIRRRDVNVLVPLIIIAATLLPYVTASSIPPRYLLPMVPAIAMLAASAVPRDFPDTARAFGWSILIAGVLLYSTTLSLSLANNYTMTDREKVLDWIEARTEERYGSNLYGSGMMNRKIKIAHRRFAAIYDGLKSMEPRPSVRFLPLAFDADELRRTTVSYIVLSLPSFHDGMRSSGKQGDFIRKLDRGEFRFRLALVVEAPFFSETLYTWIDPELQSDFARGRIGFRLYERTN